MQVIRELLMGLGFLTLLALICVAVYQWRVWDSKRAERIMRKYRRKHPPLDE